MEIRDLPALNAFLNGTCTVLLVIGYILVRRRRLEAHKRVMIAAFSVSVLFLISYLVYHFNVGSRKFVGPQAIRAVYLGILLTHTILAAAVPFLAIISLSLGLRAKFDKHRRISRWTLPIWLYVSVTGVIVYLMLYQLYPAA